MGLKEVLSDHEIGFRGGISTNVPISVLTSELYSNIGKCRPVWCVFLDLTKSFDTVVRELGDCRYKRTIRESNGDLCCESNPNCPTEAKIDYRFTHGIVIGPPVFSIYLNSLVTFKTSGTIYNFAEGKAFLYSPSAWRELKNKDQTDLHNILNWFNLMQLIVNLEKTFFMPFTSYITCLPNFQTLSMRKQ